MQLYTKLYLFYLGVFIALVLLRNSLQGAILGYDSLLSLMLLIFALGYFPLLFQSVKVGEICVPPQTVFRYQTPKLFWAIAVTHYILAFTTVVGAIFTLSNTIN